jgi:hypothetical protein
VRLHAFLAAAALALALPVRSWAEGAAGGPMLAASLGGGGEAGLAGGRRAGALDLEGLVGWELRTSEAEAGAAIRPELALSLGLAPDVHFAVRPGVRVAVPGTPLWLRVAADWSTARDESRWRWLLAGVAWEVRLTGTLGFYAEADTGVPLAPSAGLPLLLRAGATFRPL